MPAGKGTYGSVRGRPKKKVKENEDPYVPDESKKKKRNKSKATISSDGKIDEHASEQSVSHLNNMRKLMKTGIAFTIANKRAMKKVSK